MPRPEDDDRDLITPSTKVDQDPLPEASFPWRRGLTFLSTIALLYLLRLALIRVPVSDVLTFAQNLMLLLALVWVLYFGGASASDLAALIAAVKVRLRPGPPPEKPS